jgi:uncharacterized membrane protein (DUF2068 family)
MAQRRDRLVVLIGVFKLIKAGLLVALGVASLLAAPERLARSAERIMRWMGAYAGRDTVQHAVTRLLSVGRATTERFGLFSLCYAVVFTIEGIGLLRKKSWAEWLTVFVTASFIPVEVYELVRRPAPGKIAALVLNAAIVAYLVWRRLQDRRGHRRGAGAAAVLHRQGAAGVTGATS